MTPPRGTITNRELFSHLIQRRSQPDNLSRYANFKLLSIFISSEIDCLRIHRTGKYLHSGIKSSGWLRYLLCQYHFAIKARTEIPETTLCN